MQTAVAQASHPLPSLAPEVHGECAHVPLPELLLADALLADVVLLAAALLLAAVLLLDIRLPQGLVTGMQTLTALPSVVFTDVHALPEGHACPPLQSGAQYVSPANCAQSFPAPQAWVVRQGTQSLPPLPPVPVTPPAPVVALELVVTLDPLDVLANPPVPAVLVGEPGPVVAPGPEDEAPALPLLSVPPVPHDAAAETQRPTPRRKKTLVRVKQNFMVRAWSRRVSATCKWNDSAGSGRC